MPNQTYPLKTPARSTPENPEWKAIESIEWSSFPHLCAAFTPSPDDTLRRLLEKAIEYGNRCAMGSAIERTRARSIAAAYAETATFVKQLELLRLEASNRTQLAAKNRDN